MKWDLYQTDNEKMNSKRTASEQQVNTYKNIKNIKKNIYDFENFYKENDIDSLYEN